MEDSKERTAFIESARLRAPRLDLSPGSDGSGFADSAAQAMWLMWGDRSRMPLEAPEGHALIPKEPTDALLMSMAMRWDHGLGVPGYYDQLASALGPLGASGSIPMPSHARRLESALSTMRQLHEEVVGEGFHNPLDESFHIGILTANKASTKP